MEALRCPSMGWGQETICAASRLSRSLASSDAFPELGRRDSVRLPERGREMAVTRKSEVLGKGRKIGALRHQVQRARQPQPQVVAIERQSLDLLERLRQVHG